MKYIVFNCFGSFIRIWMFKGAVNLEREGGGGGGGGWGVNKGAVLT